MAAKPVSPQNTGKKAPAKGNPFSAPAASKSTSKKAPAATGGPFTGFKRGGKVC